MRLLTFSSSVPRWPLDKWENIVRPVAGRPPTPETLDQWCLAKNHLALIAIHRGDFSKAVKECTSQINTAFESVKKGQLPNSSIVYCVQPLVNLIRLRAPYERCRIFSGIVGSKGPNCFFPDDFPLNNQQLSEIIRPIRKDEKLRVYVGNLTATSMAAVARKANDKAMLENAIAFAAPDIKSELRLIRQLSFHSIHPSDHLNTIDPLIYGYHLVLHHANLKKELQETAGIVARKLADRAVATGNAFDLTAAVEVFGKLTPTIPENLSGHKRLYNALKSKILAMQDQIAEFELEKIMSYVSQQSADRLRELSSVSGYAAIKNFRPA